MVDKDSSIAIKGMVVLIILGVLLAGVTLINQELTQKPNVQKQVQPEPSSITVYASFFPYYEFTRNVAGEYAEVRQYLPDGTEAHDWEPRAQEILALNEADAFIYNGLGIEPYVESIIDNEFENVNFIDSSKNVSLLDIDGHVEKHEVRDGETNNEREEKHDDHDFEYDPHIWLDPILVKQQVNNIRDGLSISDPANKDNYWQNAAEYNEKLDQLDEKIKTGLSNCGKDTIVPFHNAFAYFGERYDINIVPLGGLSPDAEASASEIAEFIDFVRDNDIKVVFSEDLIDPRLAETIAAEAGAKTLILSPIESLTVEEAKNGATYIDKMESNLKVIMVAMECQ